MTDVADRIARLCTLLDDADTRTALRDAGADAVVRGIAASVQAGGPEDDVAAALDDVDTRMAAADYGYLTRSFRNYRPLPGNRAHQIDVAVCPAQHPCSRAARIDGEPAACGLTGQPMTRLRLRS
jgi:hypothetical protein